MPAEAYPTDHKALVAKAKLELMREVRPAIQDTFGDLSQYDTIVFLGLVSCVSHSLHTTGGKQG